MQRSDVIGSLAFDTTPSFPLHDAIMDKVEKQTVPPVLSMSLSTLMRAFPSVFDICPLLESLSSLAALASKKQPSHWYKDTHLTHAFTHFVHTMLSVSRYKIPDTSNPLAPELAMREVLRLASLVFIANPVYHLASNRDFRSHHGGRLRNLLNSAALNWSGLEHMELWVLIVSIVADDEEGEDKSIIVSRIKSRVRAHGFGWKEVVKALRDIAWIDGVFSMEVDKLREQLK